MEVKCSKACIIMVSRPYLQNQSWNYSVFAGVFVHFQYLFFAFFVNGHGKNGAEYNFPLYDFAQPV